MLCGGRQPFTRRLPNQVIKLFEAIVFMRLSKGKLLSNTLWAFSKYLFLDNGDFMEWILSGSVDLDETLFS